MDYSGLIQLGTILNGVSIPVVDENVNFWMMRAKGGFFYDEFIRDGFIALGWNYIDSNTSFSKSNIESIKEGIRNWYGDKVPMTAINKCMKFMYDFQEGDYVVIPNKGSTEVAICKIGVYFEQEGLDEGKEIVAIKKIENKESEIGKVNCPYKKRRKIELILRVSTKRIGHNLLRAIASYHGLNSLNDYATDVLNCIYDCYIYKTDIIFPINIARKEAIKARDFSKLMFGVSEVFCEYIDEDAVSITLNLNSPGKIVVTLKSGAEKLKKGAFPLLILSVVLFGGGVEGLFTTPGVLNGAINTIKEWRLMENEIESVEVELEGKKLDNYMKAMQLIKESEESEIDVDKVIKNMEFVNRISEDFQFEPNEKFAQESNDEVSE
ncbi:MAG: hypothetical protein Q4C97_12285 [Bacillota bacterium]|nr:hypothetical protein [Bacillota bacterium]